MSKTEIVTELQTILNDLKGITADLEQNISGLKDFLEDRKFIPKELGASIREQLEAIDAKQTEIVSKYEMLDVQKPEMQHTAIEENLSEIQKVIEENEKYRKAIAFFLELHADDEKTAETLQNRKDRIAADQIQLMEGDILKEYAEPYAWLQQAFWEKDARRKFSLIYKLVPHFEEEIVTGIHFNTLKLDENKAEPEESVPETFCAETDSADREKEETAENTAEILEEPEECPEAWKGLLIPENPSLLHVRMSAKAGTKFGVKEFRKDMCKQPLTEKMCCLLECIEEHGYSVKSLAEKNDNGYEIYKTATEKLYQYGYLKRYIVDGMGEFFTLSPRGERILYTKEAVGFINQMLKEKISNQDEGEHIEDSTNSAMTRLMAYDSACKQRILFPDYEFDTCNSVFGTDYFMIGYSMNGKKNFQWFAGVVTEDPAELQEFKDVVAEKAGADGLLVVTPYYNKATQTGLIGHYTQIADAVKIPIIMYNVPGRTGCNILPETAAHLFEHVENIVGLKEATGNVAQAARTMYLTDGKLDMYSGEDGIVVPLMSLGAIGVISVWSNVAPKQVHDMCMKFFEGDIAGAAKMQLEADPLVDALFSEVNPIPVKKALNLMGMNVGSLRAPLCEMGGENAKKLAEAMKAYGIKLA